MGVRNKRRLILIGVTGGIGAGKSTVCKIFAELGRFVIKADDIARNIANQDREARKEIETLFGDAAYLPSGVLDRRRIASIVFNDSGKRAKLDSILHPRVFAFIEQELASVAATQAHSYVLIEAALIFESGMSESLDYVIVVSAEEERCIRRVMDRDNLSRDEVERRMSAQLPMTQKIKRADFVIQNNGTEVELNSTVEFLDSMFSRISAGETS